MLEGRPHIVDAMKNGDVQLVFNTTEGKQSLEDLFSLRRTALMMKIPYYTTTAGALAASQAIVALADGALEVRPLQSYAAASFEATADPGRRDDGLAGASTIVVMVRSALQGASRTTHAVYAPSASASSSNPSTAWSNVPGAGRLASRPGPRSSGRCT